MCHDVNAFFDLSTKFVPISNYYRKYVKFQVQFGLCIPLQIIDILGPFTTLFSICTDCFRTELDFANFFQASTFCLKLETLANKSSSDNS